MWKIPGISVVVVKNDSTLYKKTFGKKNYFKDEKVDTKTIFLWHRQLKHLYLCHLEY